MATTAGEKELRRDWPHTTGLTARTTKQEGRQPKLLPEGIDGLKSTVRHGKQELL